MIAATLAAEALASGLRADELATSDDMAEGIAAIIAANRVVRESNEAITTMAQINIDRAASQDAREPDDAASEVPVASGVPARRRSSVEPHPEPRKRPPPADPRAHAVYLPPALQRADTVSHGCP